MAEKSYIQRYREGLVESIKTAGQMLINNAEELVGKVDNMSNFDISISFDQDIGSIPKLTMTKSYYPPEDETYTLYDIFRNGKPEEKKTCENCGWHVNDWGCNIDSVIAKTNPDGDCPNWCPCGTYPEKECEIRGD